jgi:uncharacterized protein YciI
MKLHHLPILFVLAIITSCNKPIKHIEPPLTEKPTGLDTALAKQMGADEYGMKQYTLVTFTAGTPIKDTTKAKIVMKEHLQYLQSMVDKGILVLVGPCIDGGDLGGISIYNCDVDEAKTLAGADPAVKEGELLMEAHGWYGAASLAKVPEMQKSVTAKKIGDM